MRRRLGAAVCVLALATAGCAGWGKARKGETYEAKKRLARELIARQDWPAAFFYADELHRERPRDPEVLVLRGIVYRERGLPGEAEADLLQALALDDGQAEAHAALGILFDVTGRGDRAERHHRRAAALVPDSPVYLNNLGFSLFLRRRHREAIEVYQRAARLSPTSRRVRTNLGFAYAAAGDLPRAAREFEMGGTPAEARNNLGYVYEQRGDLARAFELYLEALRLDPRYGKARANLEFVARKLGKDIPDDVSGQTGEDAGGSKP